MGVPSVQQQQDGQVPVAYVTDIRGTRLIDYHPRRSVSLWAVSRVRVNITRLWACSTAFIKCVCEMHNNDEPLPPVSYVAPFRPAPVPRGNAYDSIKANDSNEGLGIGDEICIHMGYIDNIEISDKELSRVFVGVIDTITESCNPNEGATLMIECRDRMKYMMDSLSTYNSAEITPERANESREGKERREFIKAIARNAVGDFQGSNSCTENGCGYTIFDSDDNLGSYEVDHYYTQGKKGTSVYKVGEKPKVSLMPRFHVLSGRDNYTSNNQNFAFPNVTEKVAVEHIKYLSLQEPYVTEFFSHNVNGDYYYIPRHCDVSSLNDPKRLYRTYFNRIAPPGLGKLYPLNEDRLHPAQMAIMYQEENSLIAWRSNIILRNAQNIGTNEKYIHMKTTPFRYENRGFPCSYIFVTDSSLEKPADYLAVGLSYLRRIAKETRSAQLHVIGDPSLSPGELVQVVGSMNKQYKATSQKNYTAKDELQRALTDRENVIQYLKSLKQEVMDLINESQSSTSDSSTTIKGVGFSAEVNVTIAENDRGVLQCPKNNQQTVQADVPLDYESEVTTVWRIDGVKHRLNDGWAGYRTELILLPPF
jgi:hypothetical protein